MNDLIDIEEHRDRAARFARELAVDRARAERSSELRFLLWYLAAVGALYAVFAWCGR